MSKFQRAGSILAGIGLILLIIILLAASEEGFMIVAAIMTLSLLFSASLISMSTVWVIVYLLAVYAFSGAIDILRAVEAKKNGAPAWNIKLISGSIRVAATIALFILGVIFRDKTVMVFGYCVNLGYAAVMRFINAFRRTAIVYIQ